MAESSNTETVLSKLPDCIHYPLMGLLTLTILLGAAAVTGAAVWLIVLALKFAFAYLTWRLIGVIVAFPLGYWALYALGKDVVRS